MSRNKMPGLGKSGMSRMRSARLMGAAVVIGGACEIALGEIGSISIAAVGRKPGPDPWSPSPTIFPRLTAFYGGTRSTRPTLRTRPTLQTDPWSPSPTIFPQLTAFYGGTRSTRPTLQTDPWSPSPTIFPQLTAFYGGTRSTRPGTRSTRPTLRTRPALQTDPWSPCPIIFPRLTAFHGGTRSTRPTLRTRPSLRTLPAWKLDCERSVRCGLPGILATFATIGKICKFRRV